jgi:hypothetical protein
MFEPADREQLLALGIAPDEVERQLRLFAEPAAGPPHARPPPRLV